MSHSEHGGTSAGYRRHLRDGETACPACLEAHRQYNRQHAKKPDIPDYERMVAVSLAEGLIDPEDVAILLKRRLW